MMAYRIAYCKINYPLAYYAAYFSIRADAFSYEIMCQGKDKLNYYIQDYKKRSDSLSKKNRDVMKDMKIVQECMPGDLNSCPSTFTGRRRGSSRSLTESSCRPWPASKAWGTRRPEAVEEAAKDGKYLSLDDFRQRTKSAKRSST